MMKLILFFLSFGFLQASATQFPVEIILSAKKDAVVSEQQWIKVLSVAGIENVSNVFPVQEMAVLKKLGLSYMANNKKLMVLNSKAFNKVKDIIEIGKIPLQIDINDMNIKPQAAQFEHLQWALNNSGQPQRIDLDQVINFMVQGRPNEDLGIKNVKPFVAAKKIRVAVLDTGVDKNHPDLSTVIVKNQTECVALEKFLSCIKETSDRKACEKTWFDLKNPLVDQDKNGYPLDCSGWTLLGGVNAANIMGRPDFTDEQGHGTHVTGIIAATGKGTKGVSSNVEILPVQVLGKQPSEPIKPQAFDMTPDESKKQGLNKTLGDMVARGVIYAMSSGAKVINFSMGWPGDRDSQFMRQVIAEAQNRGIVIVAAAGNDSTRALLRPCAYNGVICVGATGPDGALAHYSNFGSGVDVAAPGSAILSTTPMSKRSIRLREAEGYDYLSGTSQASPAVAGLIAELLARGFPENETYSRLILGARPVQKPLALINGQPHEKPLRNNDPLQSKIDASKYVMSGSVDLERALSVKPQALIVANSKERSEILWNRETSQLEWNFELVNKWQDVAANQVDLSAQINVPSAYSIRPTVVGVTVENKGPIWKTNEIRKVKAILFITDSSPEQSRIPSDLELNLKVNIAGQPQPLRLILDGEVIVPVDLTDLPAEALSLPILNFPKARTSLLPVDENLDRRFKMDYLIVNYEKDFWTYWLMSQKQDEKSPYELSQPVKIKAPKDEKEVDNTREQIVARFDSNNDGGIQYVLGIYTDNSSKDDVPSTMDFNFFDSQFKLTETVSYDSKKAQIPFTVKWMSIAGKRRPVWIGPGRDPDRKQGLWDLWNDPEDKNEVEKIRLYWLDENNKLHGQEKHNDFQIVDVLEPTSEQAYLGVVPILLAKNRGTEINLSYIYDFAVAEIKDGKINNFKAIDLFADNRTYRNLLDTRIDRVLSTDYENEITKGTYWFGEGKTKEQRLSILSNQDFSFTDKNLKALRSQVDAALWVRSVYLGEKISAAFVLTNSEMQYHDLNSGVAVSRSLERYTFYPDMILTNLQFPLVVGDLKMKTKLPALFTSEASGLNRGVKITIPHYNDKGEVIELVSPARLRFRSQGQCKPLDAPVWGGKDSAAALDYFCRDRIIRFDLVY
jgi:subtilisin family serine protease